MRNKLCMAAGISIITIFLYPVCGEFSTYLVIYYTVFVSVIGQKKNFKFVYWESWVTYIMFSIPIEKLYENGFTTKILGHGIGLYNAKEILNKYPVVMHFTECKDSCFTQELLIPQS